MPNTPLLEPQVVACNYFTDGQWLVVYDDGTTGCITHDGAPGPVDEGLTPADIWSDDDA